VASSVPRPVSLETGGGRDTVTDALDGDENDQDRIDQDEIERIAAAYRADPDDIDLGT
jgi:hypothetical protein